MATSTIWSLTTIFTPPASCQFFSQPFDTCTRLSSGDLESTLIACGFRESSACYPTPFDTGLVKPTWSPGVCPSGYTAVTAYTTAAPGPERSAAHTSLCCQPGLTYVSDGFPNFPGWYTSVCYSKITAARGYSTLSVTRDGSSDLVTATALASGPTSQNQYAYQSPLTVVWRSADLSLFQPTSAPIRASPASNTAKSTSPAAKDTSAASSLNSSGSLSTGAEAGIGVGVAIAFLAAICVIAFCMLRLRKKRQRSANVAASARMTYKENYTYELDLTPPAPRHEVSGGFEGHELSNKPRNDQVQLRPLA